MFVFIVLRRKEGRCGWRWMSRCFRCSCRGCCGSSITSLILSWCFATRSTSTKRIGRIRVLRRKIPTHLVHAIIMGNSLQRYFHFLNLAGESFVFRADGRTRLNVKELKHQLARAAWKRARFIGRQFVYDERYIPESLVGNSFLGILNLMCLEMISVPQNEDSVAVLSIWKMRVSVGKRRRNPVCWTVAELRLSVRKHGDLSLLHAAMGANSTEHQRLVMIEPPSGRDFEGLHIPAGVARRNNFFRRVTRVVAPEASVAELPQLSSLGPHLLLCLFLSPAHQQPPPDCDPA